MWADVGTYSNACGGLLLVLIGVAAIRWQRRTRKRAAVLQPAVVALRAGTSGLTTLEATGRDLTPRPSSPVGHPSPASRPPASLLPAPSVGPIAPASRPPSQPLPADAPSIICEIKWVRSKGRSEFQAIASTPDDAKALIASSPGFRWRLPVAPDATPAAAAAHKALVDQLLAAGWRRCGRGGALSWYADRFRALASESIEPLTADAPPLICEIKFFRVKGRSEFRAIAATPDGAKTLIASSPGFRWRLPVAPDATAAAAAAHKALVDQLLAAGWTACDGGGLLHWYADRFRSPEPSARQPGIGDHD